MYYSLFMLPELTYHTDKETTSCDDHFIAIS